MPVCQIALQQALGSSGAFALYAIQIANVVLIAYAALIAYAVQVAYASMIAYTPQNAYVSLVGYASFYRQKVVCCGATGMA